MVKKGKKQKGHYCRICGEIKSNESFSGKGHKQHIFKKCATMPKDERKQIEKEERLWTVIMRHPKSRSDWEYLENVARNKNNKNWRTAQEFLEEHSSHYKAKIVTKKRKHEAININTNRKIMKELLEQIETAFAEFKSNAELQESKCNKAAGMRARKASLSIEKAMKEFRKASLEASK